MEAHRNFDDIKPFIKDKKVLDVGAGAGTCILPFAGKGSMGMDICPQGENVIYGEASSFKLNEKFDVVTLCSVIEHLPSKAQVLKAFKNAHRHLKDKGLIIVQCPHANDYGSRYEFDHEQDFTHHSVQQGLERAGFKIVGSWTHLRLPKDQWFVHRFGVVRIPISNDYIMWPLAGINLLRDVVVVGEKR